MVIQRTILDSKRVELQSQPIILPTTAWDELSAGDMNRLTDHRGLKYAVISWDGDSLGKITPSAAYEGAFAQYQTRVKQDLDIDISDKAIIGIDA